MPERIDERAIAVPFPELHPLLEDPGSSVNRTQSVNIKTVSLAGVHPKNLGTIWEQLAPKTSQNHVLRQPIRQDESTG